MRPRDGASGRFEGGDGTRATEADRLAESFDRTGTLGVEEEFFIVDGAGRPVPVVDRLVSGEVPPVLRDRLDTEMYRCLVETKTVVCDGVDELADEIRSTREALVRYASQFGYGIAAAGLHPGMRDSALEIPDTGRYREMLERFRYPQYRNTAAGLHVHVGVDDADKAVWVANELRWYLPVLLALSANSPFYRGHDTGLSSARAQIFSELPNTGIPTSFDSFADFVDFRETMCRTDSIADGNQLWWDVRPHTECGTVEIRACDAQSDVRNVVALAEASRALVVDLAERYEDGENGSTPRMGFLEENRWRALRDGHEASFIERGGDGQVELRAVVDRLCDRLGVDGIRACLNEESGARRQRRHFRRGGITAACDVVRLDRPSPHSNGTLPRDRHISDRHLTNRPPGRSRTGGDESSRRSSTPTVGRNANDRALTPK